MLAAYIFTFKSVINHGSGELLIFKNSAHCHITLERLFLTVFCQLIFIVLTGSNIYARRLNSFQIQRLGILVHGLTG